MFGAKEELIEKNELSQLIFKAKKSTKAVDYFIEQIYKIGLKVYVSFGTKFTTIRVGNLIGVSARNTFRHRINRPRIQLKDGKSIDAIKKVIKPDYPSKAMGLCTAIDRLLLVAKENEKN
jgi:hypothetical protein